MPCEHRWRRYTDLPGGEQPNYWQCSICGEVGLMKVKANTMPKDPEFLKPRSIKCTVKGCCRKATGRNWGRTHLGRVVWVCDLHWAEHETTADVCT